MLQIGLTGFKCRCGYVFCGSHRLAEAHACDFDYKTAGRDNLAKANPLIQVCAQPPSRGISQHSGRICSACTICILGIAHTSAHVDLRPSSGCARQHATGAFTLAMCTHHRARFAAALSSCGECCVRYAMLTALHRGWHHTSAAAERIT